MANQIYKQPQPSSRRDDDHGIYDDQLPSGGSAHGQDVSAGAQKNLDDIDNLLNDIGSAESNPTSLPKSGAGSGFYKPDSNPTTNIGSGNSSFDKRTGKFLKGKKGRNILIGSGIAGLGVGGAMSFLSVVSGPLEFIHISQYLQGAHFSRQENAGDSRLGAMYRWMKKGNTVGETRISWLESKYKDRMLGQLKSAGLEPKFNSRTGYYEGFFVDQASEKSPYHGITNDQAKALLAEKYGVAAYQIRDGKFYVPERTFFAQHKSLNGLSKELGYSKVTTAVRTRVLSKYGLVTWHPMRIIDKKANESIAKVYENWKTAREKRLSNGSKASSVKASGASETDNNGKATSLSGQDETLSKTRATQILDSAKSGTTLKVTGGVAAAVGVACIVRTVSDKLGEIRYEQVVAPLTRQGMDAITVGSQIELTSDADVSEQEMGFIQKSFAREDKSGKIVDTWDQSASIVANNGGTGGVPMAQGTKDLLNNVKPDWIKWADGAAVGAVCSTAGQVITGTVSVAIGVISGGTVSTLLGAVVTAVAAPGAIDRISSLVGGDAANIAAEGAQWGNNIDYGAKLGSNLAALQMGGDSLTKTQLVELNSITDAENKADFAHKSMFARAFDPTDRRSLTAHLTDAYNNTSPAQTVASVFNNIVNLPRTFANAVGSVFFSSHAHAAAGNYDYGIATYGFSASDLANTAVQNPVVNAEAVAVLLDKNGQSGTPDYIQKADECFGVAIAKDANQKWGAVPKHDVRTLYDGTYDNSGCVGSNDPNWLKVRFFIFDTGVMEAYSCLQGGDEDSCVNSGFGVAATTAPTPSAGSTVTGDLGASSDSIACAANTKDLGVTTSQYTGDLKKQAAPIKVRLCQLSSISGVGQDTKGNQTSGGAVVNSRVSVGWQTLGEKAKAGKLNLSANSSFRLGDSCGGGGNGLSCAAANGSMHQLGIAIDFSGPTAINENAQTCAVRVRNPGNPTWNWLNNNASRFGFKQYSAEAWHWDASPMANRCGGDGS